MGLQKESIPVIVEPVRLPDPVRDPEPDRPEEPGPRQPVPAEREPASA